MEAKTEALAREVFRQLEQQGLTNEVLSALNFVYRQNLPPALDLVDRKCVSRRSCPAGTVLYQVQSTGGGRYLCFAGEAALGFCECAYYNFTGKIK